MNEKPAWNQEKWKEAIAALLRRSTTDVAFRQKCLTDPRGAVKEIGGLELGAQDKLRFVDPRDGLVLMLPPLRAAAAGLSDAALENAAGAGGPTSFTCDGGSCHTHVGCPSVDICNTVLCPP